MNVKEHILSYLFSDKSELNNQHQDYLNRIGNVILYKYFVCLIILQHELGHALQKRSSGDSVGDSEYSF